MYINHIETLLPDYVYTLEELTPHFEKWVKSQGDIFTYKAMRVLKGANIQRRHTIAPLDVLFSERSIEEVNGLYREKSIELATQILKKTLKKTNLKPIDIDCLITTSCTGFMIPAVNAYLANNIGLRKDVRHMPITEVGCTAGATSLIYAYDYLKAYPKHKVAILNLEFPSNTIQLSDFSWDNIVGTALFADGLSCTIASNEKGLIEIEDVSMFHKHHSIELLGYNLTNTGLRMNLDKDLPNEVEENFTPIVESFLKKNNLKLNDVGSFLVHPGGLKILQKIEDSLTPIKKDVSLSREVMTMHGNLSSATLSFIIKAYLEQKPSPEKIIMLSFGPGFSAHQLLAKSIGRS